MGFKKTNTTDFWAVDSLRIRMPLNELKSFDTNLQKNLLLVQPLDNNEFDVISERSNMFEYSHKGSRVFVQIKKFFKQISDKEQTEYLDIAFSSKILKHRYFTGIRSHHLKYLSDELQSFGFAEWDFATFCKARPSDIDFKKDVYVKSPVAINDWLSTLVDLTKPSKKSSKGYNHFSNLKKQNIGLEYGKRTGSSNMAHPYFKYYYKNGELNTKSKEFKYSYLQGCKKTGIDLSKTILRLEFTIKGRIQYKNMTDKPFTLKNVLELSQSELQRESSRIHKYYINIDSVERKSGERTMTQKEVLIKLLLTAGVGKENISDVMTRNYITSLERMDSFLHRETPNSPLSNKGSKMKTVLSKSIAEIHEELQRNKPELKTNYPDLYDAFLKP